METRVISPASVNLPLYGQGSCPPLLVDEHGRAFVSPFWRGAEFDEYLHKVVADVVKTVLAERLS